MNVAAVDAAFRDAVGFMQAGHMGPLALPGAPAQGGQAAPAPPLAPPVPKVVLPPGLAGKDLQLVFRHDCL